MRNGTLPWRSSAHRRRWRGSKICCGRCAYSPNSNWCRSRLPSYYEPIHPCSARGQIWFFRLTVLPVQAEAGELAADEGQVPEVNAVVRTGDRDETGIIGQKGHRV